MSQAALEQHAEYVRHDHEVQQLIEYEHSHGNEGHMCSAECDHHHAAQHIDTMEHATQANHSHEHDHSEHEHVHGPGCGHIHHEHAQTEVDKPHVHTESCGHLHHHEAVAHIDHTHDPGCSHVAHEKVRDYIDLPEAVPAPMNSANEEVVKRAQIEQVLNLREQEMRGEYIGNSVAINTEGHSADSVEAIIKPKKAARPESEIVIPAQEINQQDVAMAAEVEQAPRNPSAISIEQGVNDQVVQAAEAVQAYPGMPDVSNAELALSNELEGISPFVEEPALISVHQTEGVVIDLKDDVKSLAEVEDVAEFYFAEHHQSLNEKDAFTSALIEEDIAESIETKAPKLHQEVEVMKATTNMLVERAGKITVQERELLVEQLVKVLPNLSTESLEEVLPLLKQLLDLNNLPKLERMIELAIAGTYKDQNLYGRIFGTATNDVQSPLVRIGRLVLTRLQPISQMVGSRV